MINSQSTPTVTKTFSPAQCLSFEVDLPKLRDKILQFAMRTFDQMDADGNSFVSVTELETALNRQDLLAREIDYINFMLCSIEKIGRSFPDSNGSDSGSISRVDVAIFFEKVFSLPGA